MSLSILVKRIMLSVIMVALISQYKSIDAKSFSNDKKHFKIRHSGIHHYGGYYIAVQEYWCHIIQYNDIKHFDAEHYDQWHHYPLCRYGGSYNVLMLSHLAMTQSI